MLMLGYNKTITLGHNKTENVSKKSKNDKIGRLLKVIINFYLMIIHKRT